MFQPCWRQWDGRMRVEKYSKRSGVPYTVHFSFWTQARGEQIKVCFASFVFYFWAITSSEREEGWREKKGGRDGEGETETETNAHRPHRLEIPLPWYPQPGNCVMFGVGPGGVKRGPNKVAYIKGGLLLGLKNSNCWKGHPTSFALGSWQSS